MAVLKVQLGKAGSGYLVDFIPEKPDQNATLCAWFLDMPSNMTSMGLWDKYMLSIIHLRDIEGVPPAHKDYPEAEYEIILYALDPRENPNKDDQSTWQLLRPINYRKQFHGIDDEQAKGLADLTVKGIVDGVLWVEMEGVRGMREMWDSAIDATIDHFIHPEKCKCHEHRKDLN